MINNLVNENISSISSLSKTWEIMKFMLLYAAVRIHNIKGAKTLIKKPTYQVYSKYSYQSIIRRFCWIIMSRTFSWQVKFLKNCSKHRTFLKKLSRRWSSFTPKQLTELMIKVSFYTTKQQFFYNNIHL